MKYLFKRWKGVMADFAAENTIYDQVRFLDPSGMEIARVNRLKDQLEIVPKESLQDKRSRYYFQEALSLNDNEVYISKFDLNLRTKSLKSQSNRYIALSPL